MRFPFLAFALVLLPLSATAQDRKGHVAPRLLTSVQINGQPIKGKVLEIDGRHYVAVEDLAQSLRGTISYGDGQIALTLPQLSSMTAQPPLSPPASAMVQPASSQLPSMAARPLESGRIRGTYPFLARASKSGTSPTLGAKFGLRKVVLKSRPAKTLLRVAPR